jgi:hypothetical protein
VSKCATSSDIQETSLLGSVSHAWRALRHRNFKLFFAGQSISVIGTWMTRLATFIREDESVGRRLDSLPVLRACALQ